MNTTATIGQVLKVSARAIYRVVRVEAGHVYLEKLNPKTGIAYKSPLRRWDDGTYAFYAARAQKEGE